MLPLRPWAWRNTLSAHLGLTNMKFAAPYGQGLSEQRFGVRKDWPELASILDKALDSLADNERLKLYRRWSQVEVADVEIIKTPLAQLELTTKESAWLKEHPKLTFSVPTNAPPLYYSDERGELAGINIDYLQLLARKIGINIEIKGYSTWSSALEDAKKHIVDGIPNADATEDRKPYLNFTDSYSTFPQVIVTREDYDLIGRFEEISGKKIAVKRSSSRVHLVKKQYPATEIIEVDHIGEGLNLLSANKVDALYADLAQLDALTANKFYTNIKYAVVAETPPVGLARIGLRNDDPLLLNIFNKAIANISRQEHLALKKRWLPSTKSTLTKKIELNAKEQSWLAEHPKIILGGGVFLPLDGVNQEGHAIGIGPDYTNLMAKMLGIQFEYVSGEWAKIHEMAQEKKIDGIRMLAKNTEREKYLTYSDPYTTFIYGIFSRRENTDLNSLHNLSGRTIAVLNKSVDHTYLAERYPDIKLVIKPSYSEALDAVLQGEAEAAVGSASSLNYLAQDKLAYDVTMIASVPELEQALYVAVRNDWPQLASILSKTIAQIPAEKHLEIKNKWAPNDSFMGNGLSQQLSLTAKEVEWLRQHPVLRVGFDSDWPPVEYANKESKHKGISADYIILIAKMLGVTIEPETSQSWQETIDLTKKGELDVLPAVTPTPQRHEYLSFTSPYVSFPMVIVTDQSVAYISDMNELAGKKVAVVSDYASHDILESNHPEITLQPVRNLAEGLHAVQDGDTYAFVGSLASISHIMSREGMTGLKVSGETPYSYDIAIGTRKDTPILAGIIQKALDAIPEEKQTEIFNRWVAISYERGIDYTLLWQVLLGAALILMVFVYWNRRLAREVTHRKQAEQNLEATNRSLEFVQFGIDHAVDMAYWLYADEGRLFYVNNATANRLGYEREEMVGMTVSDFDPVFPTTEWPQFVERLKAAESLTFESRNMTKNGEVFPVEVTARWLKFEDQDRFIAFGRDISERKQQEAEVLQAKEATELANKKLKELDMLKSMFIASMSHELRTPLNSIIGFTGMTLEELSGDLNEEQRDNLSRVFKSARHLLNLITDVIDISKIEAGRVDIFPENFSLKELVDEATGSIQGQLKEKDLQLEVELPKEINMRSDRKRILQCLLNLLSNAIKYSEKGTITLKAVESRDNVIISISDTGIGIAEADMPKLFKAFERFESLLRVKAGGTGLGLYLTRKIVTDILAGKITAESELAKGSTFTITIPINIDKEQKRIRVKDYEESAGH